MTLRGSERAAHGVCLLHQSTGEASFTHRSRIIVECYLGNASNGDESARQPDPGPA